MSEIIDIASAMSQALELFSTAIPPNITTESNTLNDTNLILPNNGHTTTIQGEEFDWTGSLCALLLCALIIITVIGNTLVILSVLTTRRLRTVTNCFVMSLAVADWLVGIFVMPPAVAVMLIGSWQLGWILCDIWISLDVLLCTASILSLCAISIDRYLAVTQPLNYSRRRRSKRLAMTMIVIVWTAALAITCPPILGWYDDSRKEKPYVCTYNQNQGYVVFSAMGSFFIPMGVMVYVYARISCVVATRHDHLKEIEKNNKHFDVGAEPEVDIEPSSEQELQSPYHKKQHSFRQSKSNISIDMKESKTAEFNVNRSQPHQQKQDESSHQEEQLQELQQLQQRSLEQEENDDKFEENSFSNRSTSQKRYKPRSTNAAPTVNDHWSKFTQPVQYSIKQNNTVLYELQRHQQQNSSSSSKQTTRIHHKSLSNRILSLKRESKTTQTLSIVVGGFIVCWLPFFICYLMNPFLPDKTIDPTLNAALTWLGWFNSAMNPFIYAFYSVDFRAAFWRLTLRRFFNSSTKTSYSSNIMSIKR